ncbi:MAG: diguanylate phosphodiesterase [Rhodocyclales bacterium]|nr:diguanylate phosphodiesterase [Rhodocyclales bacterium]
MERQWFLESVAADGSIVTRNIDQLPYRIGRDADNHLVVAAVGLSRHHAYLTLDVSTRLKLTDLDSTNGSFVNRERVEGSRLLQVGDILHFGTAEFRLKEYMIVEGEAAPTTSTHTVVISPGTMLSEYFVAHEAEFMALLAGRGLTGAAQPIVHAADSTVFAYELLGRAKMPPLPTSPIRLFELAATLHREVELSVAFREYGLRAMVPFLNGCAVFVNTHPKETFTEEFYRSLQRLLRDFPLLDLVVEVHETAVTETAQMRILAERLKDIGVRFAYDDFGAGQARLNELGETPAHFVKFDMGLIRDIDRASERKRRVVGDLVRLILDLGSIPLAEGVETEAEAQVCRDMGFQLLQGYLTGKPTPVESFGPPIDETQGLISPL